MKGKLLMKERKRKYSYYTYDKDGIIVTACVSKYKGQLVRATSKCMPDDEFNEETGKNIARRRVDVKIAKKKLRNLIKEYAVLEPLVNDLITHLNKIDDMMAEEEAFISCNDEYN